MPTKNQAQMRQPPNAVEESMQEATMLRSDVDRHHRSVAPIPYLSTGREPAVEKAIRRGNQKLFYRASKRVFDLIVGSVLFVAALPIILLAALFIRSGSPGSPFFVQTRLGQHGEPFKICKLRGMYIDAKQRFPSYYDYSQKTDLEFYFHSEEDPRVTPQGRIIRKTSIDELPNLWNVILGDMSLVGPRPEIPEVMNLYGKYRDTYLSVKPGVTCISKVTGRDRLTKRETIEFDLSYVKKQSFRLDMRLLWDTFRNVVLRRDVV